jgi:hypothetical protein
MLANGECDLVVNGNPGYIFHGNIPHLVDNYLAFRSIFHRTHLLDTRKNGVIVTLQAQAIGFFPSQVQCFLFVLGQTAGSEHFESMLAKGVRGTRGSGDLYTGTPSMFEPLGFVEVARRKPERSIVRLPLP